MAKNILSYPQQQKSDSPSITHDSVITFDQDANIKGQTYYSIGGSEHAILVTGGSVTISNATITKKGDASGDVADFYGTNAAVIAIKGILELNNDNISTNGSYANAVFAYGDGNILVSDSVITTKGRNSGGIMVTGGGKLTAKNLTVTTEGNSSAPIRSDRGGGTIDVEGGKYISNGVGSPVIYSTADITVNDAELIARKSEGAVVEGKNSVTIINSTLIDSNATLNGQSSTYKNIFIYQSMSGDADEGTASFVAKDSKIITNNGDTIYVTNTNANILLENTEIINNAGDFLRIEGAAWGNKGSNGGNVELNLKNQDIEGNIIVDDISSLTMNLVEGSEFIGAINSDNESHNISINLDSSSVWTLTSDSYISNISSEVEGYSNINLNGFELYIGDEVITSVDQIPVKELGNVEVETVVEPESHNNFSQDKLVLCGVGILLLIIIIVLLKNFFKGKNK